MNPAVTLSGRLRTDMLRTVSGGALVVKRVAASLLSVGSLLLAFVAYQLWGTALYEHSAQQHLQQELRGLLHTPGTLPALNHSTGTTEPAQAVLDRAAPPTAAPAVGGAVGLMSIPSIGVTNTAIVEGTGESQLQQGPGHYPGTPLPGEAGNAAIAGHRTTYGAPFYHLDALHTGDVIAIETPQGLFGYQVVTTKIVDPNDVSVLQPTALPELTLTTCNPRYSSTQRLVVQALLRTSVTNTSFVPTPPGKAKSGNNGTGTTTTPPASSLAGADNTGSPKSGSNVTGGVVGAVLFGLLALLTVLAVRYGWKRFSGSPRWLSLVGLVAALYFLLACFEHVSLALPASF